MFGDPKQRKKYNLTLDDTGLMEFIDSAAIRERDRPGAEDDLRLQTSEALGILPQHAVSDAGTPGGIHLRGGL